MTTTFIPGYLASIEIDTEDYTLFANVLGLSSTKNAPRKPTFGAVASKVISGQQSWSGEMSGHLAAEGPLAELLATYAKSELVAYTIQIGEDGGPTDGGTLTGELTLSSLDISDDAEGEWDFSAGFEIDGVPLHTPPA